MPEPSSTWRPWLEGEQAVRARDVAGEIAEALRAPGLAEVDPSVNEGSLGRGGAGIALLYAELGDEETALAFVDQAIERSAAQPPSASLYAGSLGVGWSLAHLEGPLLGEVDLGDLDDYVGLVLDQAAWPSVDLIRGVAGVGVYLLERLPDERAAAGLATVVRRLRELGQATPDGVTWWVDPETVTRDRAERFPSGYYDIGVAHGNAGVVALLAMLTTAGVDGARELLGDATSWLLSARLPEGTGPGRFPTLTAPGERPSGGRLAWCYGDPGVAVALLGAGRALGDDAVTKEAVGLALDCAVRPEAQAGVVDTAICHGSAGLMHVFARLAQQTGEERLYAAARHWFEDLLARRTDAPIAGFPQVKLGEVEPNAGFLEGVAGVALTLLAATSDRDPSWDRVLLTEPAV